MDAAIPKTQINTFTCELEDWFHILDSDTVPRIGEWARLPLCAEKNTYRLLELLAENNAKATFFCLGWMAERMPQVIRRCQEAGHEIGSHGYGHLLANRVGSRVFLDDIVRSKKILEDITGEEVLGFRSPGFCVKDENRWVFDVVAEAGFLYDASVFPAAHGHGGLRQAPPGPHVVNTRNGPLIEIPTSTVPLLGRRICLFGGGYLRLAPLPVIRWGVKRLHREGQPLVVYIHPREIDPDHPRLPLRLKRRFKCYVNLSSTMSKLRWLCEHYEFTTMKTIAAQAGTSLEPPLDEGDGRGQPGGLRLATVETRKPSATPEQVRT